MAFWRRKTEQRTLTSWPGWTQNGEQPPLGPTTALRVADVFACVRVLSNSAASLPLIPYRRTDTGRVRLSSGRLAGLLDAPAPAVTQANLIATTVSHLTLWGNSFLGKFRDEDGRINALAALHPDRVRVELKGGVPLYTVTSPKGEETRHGVDDIIHVKALSTDGLLGISPIRECKIALASAQGLEVFTEAFFRNGGRPSGIVKVGANEGGLDELSTKAQERHGGARNAHRIAIVRGDVDWIPMTGPLDDLQFIESRRMSTEEVCRIFGVMPWMVGASAGDSMTYSNTEQQASAFASYSLRPWLVVIEQAISGDADLCPGNVYVEFLLDALLRADSKTRAEVYTAALDPVTGWMRRDEVRQLENLPAEDTSAIAVNPAAALAVPTNGRTIA